VTEIPEEAVTDAAWQAWYQPEHDIARYMATSPYGKMREAFAAGFAAADPERARLRGFESGVKAERECIIRLAEDHEAHCSHCDECREPISFADLLRGESDG